MFHLVIYYMKIIPRENQTYARVTTIIKFLHKAFISNSAIYLLQLCVGSFLLLSVPLNKYLADHKSKWNCQCSTWTSDCMSHPEIVINCSSSLDLCCVVEEQACNVNTCNDILNNKIYGGWSCFGYCTRNVL